MLALAATERLDAVGNFPQHGRPVDMTMNVFDTSDISIRCRVGLCGRIRQLGSQQGGTVDKLEPRNIGQRGLWYTLGEYA